MNPKLTRQQISEAIAREAPEVPFTMPFFLAAELLKECQRQGLERMCYEGKNAKKEEEFCVSVTIKYDTPRKHHPPSARG